ncbi:hypothetical protein THAOC_35203 [Thalassiosira oceanica]|uniref:Uncharacterized protein n=1 Tax=Thalassiosira oceanica TaxID=159749 RepID=K0R264_THAOC|nr:hypothetical protein THAOC_35203 [Thalassiosira oceanica]|eukprot:EJK46145.1 hypothetical protein THAOC_35203 [Thalassiosira oceanica]
MPRVFSHPLLVRPHLTSCGDGAQEGSKAAQQHKGVGFGEGWTDMRERVYRPGRGPRQQHKGVGFGESQASRTTAKSQVNIWGTAMAVEVSTCVCGVPPLPMGRKGGQT